MEKIELSVFAVGDFPHKGQLLSDAEWQCQPFHQKQMRTTEGEGESQVLLVISNHI